MKHNACWYVDVLLILVCIHCFPTPVLGQASMGVGYMDNIHGKRVYSPIYLRAPSGGVTSRHYATIEQLHEVIGIAMEVGEVTVLTGSRDSIHVAFSHPLNSAMATPIMDVFEPESELYANPIRTMPWKVYEGDTVIFLRTPKFLFARTYPDGTPRSELDTSAIISDDTLRFRFSLVEHGSDSVLMEIDTITFYPFSNVAELYLQGAALTYRGTLSPNRIVRIGMPDAWYGKRVALAVYPTFRSQGSDPFAGRLLNVYFSYSDRLSSYFQERTERDSILFAASLAYFSALQKAKNMNAGSTSTQGYTLVGKGRIAENTYRLTIQREHTDRHDATTIRVFSILGQLVHDGSGSFSIGSRDFSIVVSSLLPGTYIIDVQGEEGRWSQILSISR